MGDATQLACACGKVCLDVEKAPIITAECHCNSCREAAARMESLPGAPAVREPNGGTRFVMFRKDRVRITEGSELLKQFRLKPEAPTRRVVASCCNSPVFLEFNNGHWLSLYSGLWPEGTAPEPELRTMTSDLPDPSVLDRAVPSGKRQTAGFYGRLLGAWIGMGFRVPKVDLPGGELRV